MNEAFSQEFCSMEPFKDSLRWVVSRPRTTPCTVRVADGELTITQDPDGLMVRVPTAGLRIVTPRRLKKLEAGVVLSLGGKPVAVMFDMVHARQEFRAASQQGKRDLIRQVAKPVSNSRGNLGLARQITAEFIAALLDGGAIDTTAPA
ncbi:hypothetical protein GXW82_01535 [Streptacidiphilus sp. 4-A2]|nr:hypothetical protein [Streptacidiphilus sp. 4-A2]